MKLNRELAAGTVLRGRTRPNDGRPVDVVVADVTRAAHCRMALSRN